MAWGVMKSEVEMSSGVALRQALCPHSFAPERCLVCTSKAALCAHGLPYNCLLCKAVVAGSATAQSRVDGLFPDPKGQSTFKAEEFNDDKPWRAFLFILADEVLPSGKVVRKVLEIPGTSQAQYILANPEIFGMKPPNPLVLYSLGEHALGQNQSRYLSASTKPGGAPNIAGRPVYIDIRRAQAAGVKIHSSEAIIADLDRLARANPSLELRVEKLKSVISSVEGEVLLEGDVPASAIKSRSAMMATRGLRAVQVVGIAFTVHDVSKATVKSVEQKSVKPIAAESIRQVGGWAGAVAGVKIGGLTGAALGIETGPGAILTGAVGALVFGTAGYFGADWVADFIDKN